MKHVVSLVSLVVGAIVVGSLGCSSSSSGQDQGLAAPTGDVQAADVNPYGVAYPTQNIGFQHRANNVKGDVIKNLKFLGYRNPDSKAITPKGQLDGIALADFYDPDGKLGIKVIHITVASVWCGPCNQETDDTIEIAAGLRPKGVIFLQALNDGPTQGKGATQTDLNKWIDNHQTNFTELLDPTLIVGPLFPEGAVPFNADIDARSMEILYADVGAPADMSKHVLDYVAWTDSHPPSYTRQ